MDLSNLSLSCLAIVGQGLLHILFISRLTGKKAGIPCTALYLSLLCAIFALSAAIPLGGLFSLCAEVLALWAGSRFALKSRPAPSWVSALLAVCISQLSSGVVSSLGSLILPPAVGTPLLCPLLLLSALASLGLCGCCYLLALRCLSPDENSLQPHPWLLLLPTLFFFLADFYILETVYCYSSSTAAPATHLPLLALQSLGLGVLFSTLYAYRQICRSFQTQAALASLAQAARAQRTYAEEAQQRFEKTRAFRHDIQNHLAVLGGLLRAGQSDAAKTYLENLNAAAGALSFPCQTGNPVVDVLLAEKLELAQSRGIDAAVSLTLPRPCAVDDFDLCVIFANALDNAIHACPPNGTIRISGKHQGGMYLLSFKNTCPAGPLPPMGTGLSNIKAAAEKYRGAISVEKDGAAFRLDVLFNTSPEAAKASGALP